MPHHLLEQSFSSHLPQVHKGLYNRSVIVLQCWEGECWRRRNAGTCSQEYTELLHKWQWTWIHWTSGWVSSGEPWSLLMDYPSWNLQDKCCFSDNDKHQNVWRREEARKDNGYLHCAALPQHYAKSTWNYINPKPRETQMQVHIRLLWHFLFHRKWWSGRDRKHLWEAAHSSG